MRSLTFLSVVFLFHSGQAADIRVDPLVLIDQGLVRGEKSSDGDYSSFLGVPYATVDSKNPFGASLAHDGFGDEVFNAYDDSITCPQSQSLGIQTTDCLRLNVFVPTKANTKNPMPVLVYIHGGSFSEGSAALYNAQNIVSQDIVFVSINYRLGPYGFMCLNDPSVPGNQGLKDQLAALRWVKSNIASFGGNPYNVTIAGQSSGSASVDYHLHSSYEKLFNKAILQSGVSQSTDAFIASDTTAAQKIAQHLGFNTTDTKQALEFLTATPSNLVIAATEELGLRFAPCKEKSFSGVENFIENDPFGTSDAKNVKNTPILIGTTSVENLGLNFFDDISFGNVLNTYFSFDDDELKIAEEIVRHFYIGDSSLEEANKESLEGFSSDFSINHPVESVVTKLLEEKAIIYQYVFSYGEDESNRAGHKAELEFLFNKKIDELNEQDKIMSERIVKLWTNFVKYGNPTPQTTELLPVKWEAVSEDKRPYLDIGQDLELKNRFRKESMAFWDLFFTKYGGSHRLIRACRL